MMRKNKLTRCRVLMIFFFFFVNDSATTEIYTLSLHDALPISNSTRCSIAATMPARRWRQFVPGYRALSSLDPAKRSEEHTSELQSHHDLVCRLLLEKKKNKDITSCGGRPSYDAENRPIPGITH